MVKYPAVFVMVDPVAQLRGYAAMADVIENKAKKTELLSTGSTLLNLACSGNWRGGWALGSYVYLVGDSQSGKTFLTMTAMAEAAKSKRFDDYRFVYDNAENGAFMDIGRFFGSKLAARLEPPRIVEHEPWFSENAEDFYYNLDDLVDAGRPFIYVLDSMDSLHTRYASAKFDERKKAAREGKKAKGDYGDGKAKINSTDLRQFIKPLEALDSMLIIVSQTRDNPDAGQFESNKTRSGGHALKFYAHTEVWSSVAGAIKKTVNDVERRIGNEVRLDVKKNRLNGLLRTVWVPIYPTYGFDDIGGCVEFLVREKHWPKSSNGIIQAPEFGFSGHVEAVAQKIDRAGGRMDLSAICGEVWADIESRCALMRQPRYE